MKSRRAFVILAVLLIIGSALYVATALIFQAQADVASSHRGAEVAQSRALAWSGIQAVMSGLNEQRERILAGLQPRIDDEFQIYETAAAVGAARLLPIGMGGETLVSEAGKLDLNTIDATALENTGMVTPDVAASIISYRLQQPGGRFQSVAELMRVPGAGLTAETLYGPLQEFSTQDSAALRHRDLAERTQARLADAHVRGLADILTVFACEPALQMNGTLRINLNVPWSDELQQRMSDRFGPEAASMTKQLFDTGVRFENEAKIFQILRQYRTPPENWPQIIDAVTSERGKYHYGRLDINSASYEALRGLPGVTPEQAAQLVRVRNDLSEEERQTVAWPAIAQILPSESYDALAGHITTRSWMYRFRLAAGELNPAEPEGELRGRVVYEVVVDLSSPTPRVAYLRDITTLQSTAQMFASASMSRAGEFDAGDSFDSAITDEPSAIESSIEASPSAEMTDNPDQNQARNVPSNDRAFRSRSPRSDSVSPQTGKQSTPQVPSAADDRRNGRWRRGD